MAPREKATRLNLWDFDDTLADSSSVVAQLQADYPDIGLEEWWHGENVSTHAAMQTEPILPIWELMASTDGEHWILTGRVLEAVLAWLEENVRHQAVGAGIDRLIDVVSTSGRKWKGDAEGTVARKAEFIAALCEQWEEIHLYDDTPEVLEAVAEACPQVELHLVKDGKVSSGAEGVPVDEDRSPFPHPGSERVEMEELIGS